ncbi:MAG: SDR family NAD(P)-dependent oxidoreductase [Pseudomonadota bacterium]
MGKEIAFVTGASSGLGMQFCKTLAANGFSVVAAARRVDKLEALCESISKDGGTAIPLELDVTNISSYADKLNEAEEKLGEITCLVNNAGVSDEKYCLKVTPDEYDHVMDVNLKGPFFLATEVAKRWVDRKCQGRMVNISSLSAKRAMNGLVTYGMSKAAISRMTELMAFEWAKFGINVNAIAPGIIATEINADSIDTPGMKMMVQFMPRKRLGMPSDLDDTILYLTKPGQRFLTGQVIYLDDAQGL